MLKKLSVFLIIALLMTMILPQVVMAAVLEVDTSNPAFKSDTWQNNEPTEVYPIELAFSTTHTRGDGDGNPVERFCANIQDGADNVEGQLSELNGSAINNAVFPFKETVRIDSVTWKWNNGGRQYFLLFYTSMDNVNWTEVEITGNASKVKVENTYDPDGGLDGPAVECYATVPAGLADNDDVNPITFTFKQTPDAKYFKIVMFGNDGESGDLAVSHPWVSFNNMKFEGEIAPAAVEEAPAAVDEAASGGGEAADAEVAPVVVAVAPAPVAPRVGDTSIIILAGIMLASGVVIYRRKIAVK